MMPHPLGANVKGRGAAKRRLMWSAIVASKKAICSRTMAHPTGDVEFSSDGLLEAIISDGWKPPRTKMQMSRSHYARMFRQQDGVRHRYTRSGELRFRCGCSECSSNR